MAQTFVKDPDATLDYIIDWSEWLDTDTISTSTWTVPTGLTNVSDSNTTTTATIWLSGGTAGQRYTVSNRIAYQPDHILYRHGSSINGLFRRASHQLHDRGRCHS